MALSSLHLKEGSQLSRLHHESTPANDPQFDSGFFGSAQYSIRPGAHFPDPNRGQSAFINLCPFFLIPRLHRVRLRHERQSLCLRLLGRISFGAYPCRLPPFLQEEDHPLQGVRVAVREAKKMLKLSTSKSEKPGVQSAT